MSKNSNHISINKYISDTGYCSRREADKLIAQGRVHINGKEATKGNRVGPSDEVMVDFEIFKKKKKSQIYIALNKPIGITCTTDRKDPDNIIDYINHKKRIFPVGRLDKSSTGLILLTNDGDIVNKILRHERNNQKEYLVQTDKPITAEFLQKMRNGVRIMGKLTKKCTVDKKGKNNFAITLTQGLNRQIRRMCLVLGYKVKALHRVRIMHIHIGKLKAGEWRYLTPEEESTLMKVLS